VFQENRQPGHLEQCNAPAECRLASGPRAQDFCPTTMNAVIDPKNRPAALAA
jgi:hypothetical protein